MKKVLVANRGEIALRVFRAARELGLGTVAVVAPDDAGSLHARSADETVEIASYLDPGGAHPRSPRDGRGRDPSRLRVPRRRTATSRRRSQAAGLTWIGPPADALRRGGDKLEAKRIAAEAGVPTVPEATEPPLIVKAAAGGGGRGMRIVRSPDELDDALAAARREAQAGFGDDRVYLERYLERPRHVEIQLLADTHGTVLALGERECSVQRRHQKVLEESPSTALDTELRAQMSDAAVRFARAIGYVGAGTAEFVLEGREFFFLELNGRIQVEHPVTEAVWHIDLVQWQLRIAQGERLDVTPQSDGAAVEVRLYAEDPRTFLPQAGRLERLRLPETIRVESGVAEGDEIGTGYDPMIAKLIAAGATREEALDRLAAALDATEVGGVTTNLPFLRWLVAHPVLRAGETTTAFLTEHPPLSAPPAALPDHVWREAVPPQPAVAAGRGRAGGRRGRRRARRAGRRAEHGRRAHARHGDQGARSRRLNSQSRRAARRTRGDEDGDTAQLAVRRNGAGRPRPGGRSCRGWRGAGRSGRVAPRSSSRRPAAAAATGSRSSSRPASARISTGSSARTGSPRRSSSSCTGSARTPASNSSRGRRTSPTRATTVIYPRYESPPPDPQARNNIVGAVGRALGDLGRPDVPLVLLGHSRGGRLAVEAAAFLNPRLVIAMFPGQINPAFEPATNFKLIPKTTDIYLFVGDRDKSVGNTGALELDRRLLAFGFPAARIHGGVIHSANGFVADHGSVYTLSDAGKRAIWDRVDSLIDERSRGS